MSPATQTTTTPIRKTVDVSAEAIREDAISQFRATQKQPQFKAIIGQVLPAGTLENMSRSIQQSRASTLTGIVGVQEGNLPIVLHLPSHVLSLCDRLAIANGGKLENVPTWINQVQRRTPWAMMPEGQLQGTTDFDLQGVPTVNITTEIRTCQAEKRSFPTTEQLVDAINAARAKAQHDDEEFVLVGKTFLAFGDIAGQGYTPTITVGEDTQTLGRVPFVEGEELEDEAVLANYDTVYGFSS